MTGPSIALHVGAHKTASTHLQRSLEISRKVLKSCDVRVMNTRLYRRTIGPIHKEFADGDLTGAQARGQVTPIIHGAAKGAKRLILSDENILGQFPRTFLEDRIYPWGRYRVATTMALLENYEVELFLAIRSPLTYLQSAYSEALLHMTFRDFAGFVKPCQPTELRWFRLIEEIRTRLPDTPLTLWRYEDYPRIRSQIAAKLIGRDLPDGFTFLDRHPRPGLSARALEQLEKWHADGRDIQDGDLIAHAAALFPKGEDWPAPGHFDAATAEQMTRSYDADCARIRQLDGVTFLSADGA